MDDNDTHFWSGRFEKPPHELFEQLNASIPFDWRLAPYDIQGSIAHARMLAGIGVLTSEEFGQIEQGLGRVAAEIAGGEFGFELADEDIHSAVEKRLLAIIGDTAKKLHTGRSRNDQVATDLALYLQDHLRQHLEALSGLMNAIHGQAAARTATVLPGYTHLQRAQPVLLAHHLLAYFEMFARDYVRFWRALDAARVMPLGAGALAGVNYASDREAVAAELGFERPGDNSMDDTSNRDFALDYLGAAAILSMHLSRLAAELVLWSSQEFGFVEIADAFTSGSSIMPQKKNPDACELVRAKAARIQAANQGLCALMTGLPLTYNKDMQEDKLYVFETVENLGQMLPVMAEMVATLEFDDERMRAAAEESFALATDVADYLVGKGMPFRDAHRIVGQLVRQCIDDDRLLASLTLEELREASDAFDEGYFEIVDLDAALARKLSYGSTSPAQVALQLDRAAARLESMKEALAEE